MASAISRTSYVTYREGDGLVINLDTTFFGPDVPGGAIGQAVEALISDTDQPAAIRSKMSAAVTAAGAAQGLTVAGGNMTLPTFQKG